MAMPDFNVVCLFTIDHNLRFYISKNFDLCLTITEWPNLVMCLAYTIDNPDSMLAIGDSSGTVNVLKFPVLETKNPFRGQIDVMGRSQSFNFTKLKGANVANLTSIKLIQFRGLLPTEVRQLAFCGANQFLVSVCMASSKSMAYVWVGKPAKKRRKPNPRDRYVSVQDGFLSVCSVGKGLVATGSVDEIVRLWDFDEWSNKEGPKNVQLLGHDTAVEHVFYNLINCHLYSVAADHTVKIWDVFNSDKCLLTFNGATIATKSAGNRYIPFFFNQSDQKIVMPVETEFVTIKCADTSTDNSGVVNSVSHDAAVLKTMYCRLFRVLISVSGLDSTIAVWNLFTGQLINKWSMAHTKKVYGEMLPVEITAANFDPSGGLLVTGAVNGTVHMWDFNNATCLNRLQIPSRNRISEIIWMPNKVLVTGWDHKITEFNEPLKMSSGKVWLKSHNDVILSACEKWPSLFVTTSLGGKIGFWRLETGQLIKQHSARVKPVAGLKHSISGSRMSAISRGSASQRSMSNTSIASVKSIADGVNLESREERLRRLNVKYTPKENFAAVAAMFLRNRTEDYQVGTLLISTRNGIVQLWCTYKVPKYVNHFTAIHLDGDYVTAMASDPKNDYLLTSFNSGYVKTWYIANFGQPHTIVRPVSMPILRLRFPFLLGSLFIGRAEQAATKNASGPLLVSSYRAHLRCISNIEYVDDQELVVTSSLDQKIRIWTLAGHYVGTLGTQWPSLPKTGVVNLTKFTVPNEIRREASFTTIKVLSDGVNTALRSPELWTKLVEFREQRKLEGKISNFKLVGTKCPEKPLHNLEFMKIIETERTGPMNIQLDDPNGRIAIHRYLPVYDISDIKKFKIKENIENRSKRVGVNFEKN